MEFMKKPTDTEMLNFVGLYVTDINGIESKIGEEIEVIAQNDDEMIIVRRTKGTALVAFRECVIEAMRQRETWR